MMSDAPETRQLEECDQYKVDDDYAEYNAYRRMVEHAQQMEIQRDEARGIVLACHRAFIGGSDFCQAEARRLSADLVRKNSPPNAGGMARELAAPIVPFPPQRLFTGYKYP